MIKAADNLLHLSTEDGWRVVEKVSLSAVQTGGAFSTGYLVQHEDGRKGFLKALDFSSAMRQPDSARALEAMLASYNFERDLLQVCNNGRVSRVVRAFADGAFPVPGAPLDHVYYLIFELADGDARTQMSRTNRRDFAWASRMCHQVAVGMRQLHRLDISHQDLKPSNVLVFDRGLESKLADLGRAHYSRKESPHDDLSRPGARTYAPPEQLYAYEPLDRLKARRVADLYLLGSMIMFAYTGAALTPLLLSKLRREHKPPSMEPHHGWLGYFQDVAPYLMDAWVKCMEQFESDILAELPSTARKQAIEITSLVRYLTNPNPEDRGHPVSRFSGAATSLDLERVVSRLGNVAAGLALLKRSS